MKNPVLRSIPLLFSTLLFVGNSADAAHASYSLESLELPAITAERTDGDSSSTIRRALVYSNGKLVEDRIEKTDDPNGTELPNTFFARENFCRIRLLYARADGFPPGPIFLEKSRLPLVFEPTDEAASDFRMNADETRGRLSIEGPLRQPGTAELPRTTLRIGDADVEVSATDIACVIRFDMADLALGSSILYSRNFGN